MNPAPWRLPLAPARDFPNLHAMEDIDRSTPPLASLFQDLILEHYKRPRNKGQLEDPHASVHMNNPTCGDEVILQLRFDGDAVSDVGFVGHGCSISQASISMMTALLRGKSRAEAAEIAALFTAMMHGDQDAPRDKRLGDLRALAGVARFPVRVKCALLGFNALEEALGTQAEG
jgi:nitrogen fixation protein NifU and related proteins